MDDDVTSGDAVKFGEIINILKNLECFASTVEEVDLFNNLQNILITNAAILALSGAASLYALTLTLVLSAQFSRLILLPVCVHGLVFFVLCAGFQCGVYGFLQWCNLGLA